MHTYLLCIHIIGTIQADYNAIDVGLVFDPEDTRLCIQIAIIDDDEVEDLEMFFVALDTSDAQTQEARIYIDDPTDSESNNVLTGEKCMHV